MFKKFNDDLLAFEWQYKVKIVIKHDLDLIEITYQND
jgi:hypothetical protein